MSCKGSHHLAKDPVKELVRKPSACCVVFALIHHPGQLLFAVYPVTIVPVFFCLRNTKGKQQPHGCDPLEAGEHL